MRTTPTASAFFLTDFYSSGPFTSILFQNRSRVFPVLAVVNTGSWVGLQNKMGHLAHRYRHLMQVSLLSVRGMLIGSKTCFVAFLGLHLEIVDMI